MHVDPISARSTAQPTIRERMQPILIAWLGTFVVMSATWVLFSTQQLVYAFASLGGSAVIVFGMPGSPMAQPRSLFGGHAIGALTGCVFLSLFGRGPWAIAAAVATALAIMQVARAIHSPAGADPIIVMSASLSLPMVVLDLTVGLLLLWLTGIVLLNAFGIGTYGRDLPLIGPIATHIGSRWGGQTVRNLLSETHGEHPKPGDTPPP